jgi:predicted dehydrogenase
MAHETVKFGVIGLGLMGREFASAAARWHHLASPPRRPEIISVCSRTLAADRVEWFRGIAPVAQVTRDFREVLANPEVEAVYIAVPHNLHQEIYTAALAAGKHVMGEKPFGADRAANDAINTAEAAARSRNPGLLVRCATQFIFVPALQYIGRAIAAGVMGRILEVEAGFLHSSDLDPEKPINWKRRLATNGEYGCMGDLGMHAVHLPIRAGWLPRSVRAVLSKVIEERPDGRGGRVPCETWDNATLLALAAGPDGDPFPFTIRTFRISPGQTNTLYLNVSGTRTSFRFSTDNINVLQVLRYDGGEQCWATLNLGHAVSYPTITGKIFEFGFSDAVLQMWAAYMTERDGDSPPGPFARCATPQEVAFSHRLFTAALESHRTGQTVTL